MLKGAVLVIISSERSFFLFWLCCKTWKEVSITAISIIDLNSMMYLPIANAFSLGNFDFYYQQN